MRTRRPRSAVLVLLAFLSAGLLVGGFAEQERTVCVYVVQEDGVQEEHRVDDEGNVLSTRIVPPGTGQ